KAGIEPCLRVQPAEQGEGQPGQQQLANDALPNMSEVEVAQLVGQNSFDLIGGQFAQQRVKKNDAFVAAETGQVGVGMRAAAGTVHDVEGVQREAGALGQRLDAPGQRRIVQRFEAVEAGGNPFWVDPHQAEDNAAPE